MDDTEKKSHHSKFTREDDVRLWKVATKDVVPLSPKRNEIPENQLLENSIKDKNPEILYREIFDVPAPKTAKKQQAKDVDARTASRLRRGQLPIEARLDLHGMGQIHAYDALKDFILRAVAQRKRCLLVITGKGGRGKIVDDEADFSDENIGILRRKVPQWLNDPALSPHILQTQQAQPKDGGAGALYVLLRRVREPVS